LHIDCDVHGVLGYAPSKRLDLTIVNALTVWWLCFPILDAYAEHAPARVGECDTILAQLADSVLAP
jgi:hypothetical protein